MKRELMNTLRKHDRHDDQLSYLESDIINHQPHAFVNHHGVFEKSQSWRYLMVSLKALIKNKSETGMCMISQTRSGSATTYLQMQDDGKALYG